jgi:hypothetical protein
MKITNEYRKGKTYEEIYGIERAKEIKKLGSKNNYLKGKTYEEVYGIEKAEKLKKKLKKYGKRSKGRVFKKKLTYSGIHYWARTNIPKPKFCICPHCNKRKRLEIANISGKYKKEFSDWVWLCKKCHMIYDGLIGYRKKIKCVQCGKESYNPKYCSIKCTNLGNRKVKRPSRRELKKMLKESNYVQLGKKLGVSDNG